MPKALLALTALLGGCAIDGLGADPGRTEALQSTVVFRDGVGPTTSYAGTRDVTLAQSTPGTAFGTSSPNRVDGDDPGGSGNDLVTLLRWDLAGVPAGSTVTAASLVLYLTNGSPGPYDLYEARRDWTEREATWNQASAGIAWGTAGANGTADRGTAVLGTLTGNATGSYTLALNAAGLAVVQRWIQDPSQNHGFVFADASTGDKLEFASREASTASQRPALSISYTTPSESDAGTGTDAGSFDGPTLDASVAPATLIAQGTAWRFLDTGVDPGTSWRTVDFDDSAWRSGNAQLGYGDGDEATVVGYGPDSASKYITTYFRRAFDVATPASYGALTLRILRDDGAVVYLNGTEVYRTSMPTGTVTSTTLAANASCETCFETVSIPAGMLRPGTNVLAVEVHQASAGSTDLSFDLSLGAGTSSGGDAGSAIDASVGTDSATRPDANVATDSGAGTDANVATDSGAGTDASVATDAGSSGAVAFAVIGDFGYHTTPYAGDVARLVHGWSPEFIVSVGDTNYTGGSNIDQDVGQYYHDFIYPYRGSYGAGASTQRFFSALGNTDWTASTGAQAYLNYFEFPGNERYYSVTRGPVQFFFVDSDSNEPDGTSSTSVQATWLRNALAASSARWKVVLLHHPPYSSGSYGSQTRMQWPFAAWGAHLVLAGHEHDYERVARDGITYVVCGVSGKDSLRGFGTPISGSLYRFATDWGAMRATASNTAMRFEFITRDGVVHDTFTLP